MGTVRKIFWTGGFDSTYRLIQLLLETDYIVQPFYVIDENRKSLKQEIQRQSMIKSLLREKFDIGEKRLLDTIVYLRSDIRLDAEISKAYHRITNEQHLGSQYEWLAAFCRQLDLDDVEMGVIRRDIPDGHSTLERMLRPLIGDTGRNGCRRIINSETNPDIAEIFASFSFPTIDYTKAEMRKNSDRKGWSPVLDLSWFCLHPRRDGLPCGTCNPCRIAIIEGNATVFPLQSRIANRIRESRPVRMIMR